MAAPSPTPGPNKYQPYVPTNVSMKEYTLRAVLLGLVMTLVLGAANAYLGLTAGLTIAATYPAAVISMAVLRLGKGTILEENLARTAGSIGESVAAGAIFTLPAFVIAGIWTSFRPEDAYWKSTVLMIVGSILGVLFVSLVRRVMVEDPELPFPESVAAAEVHKAGQSASSGAKFLFANIGLGALIYALGWRGLYATEKALSLAVGTLGSKLKLGALAPLTVGGQTVFALPSVKPALVGVGYVIGPKLASLNFAGGLIAWGLLIPLILFFSGPEMSALNPGETEVN